MIGGGAASCLEPTLRHRCPLASVPVPTPSTTRFSQQVEVLRREVARLTSENARLHSDLLHEADARQAGEHAAALRVGELEGRLAEAQLAQRQALDAAKAGEKEREGLKAKVVDLLAIGRHVPPGEQWRRGRRLAQVFLMRPALRLGAKAPRHRPYIWLRRSHMSTT